MQLKNALLILLVFVLLICSNPSSQVQAKSLKVQGQSTSSCGQPKASCSKSNPCCPGSACVVKKCVLV
ncbi:hypothetical protein TTHERM_000836760 (macronuclear) [Tetrahymena thermophila SB210]|uniref:Transmembrane protein n=1 Tax=Tetrahymena thermophila (strain SB210) TaxID=312017 RepID=W7WXT4_TETTS|nr:hypothetical protein TTHERM_000836760 [Tetrahymena thermophila SB210]EWS71650.1 hypothetical protein TTHERM_000836760 [Tetrahymena thermophila SB210]|eukprot:XP_012655810.1 hypothetical protein TTHERM_000836760 [Tetrahymena thermophila SB210]